MGDLELRAKHKFLEIKIASASAGVGASGAASFLSFGLTFPITAIGARRININMGQCKPIKEQRLLDVFARSQNYDAWNALYRLR